MGRSGTGALTVSAIPLHIQKRFEPRWASRFTLPAASKAPKNVGTKAAPQWVGARGKDQRKTRRVETAGFSQFFRGKSYEIRDCPNDSRTRLTNIPVP